MKRKDAEEALLEFGVEKGVILFDELEDLFPAGSLPLEDMEGLLMRLEGLGVRVVEKDEGKVTKPGRGRKAA